MFKHDDYRTMTVIWLTLCVLYDGLPYILTNL